MFGFPTKQGRDNQDQPLAIPSQCWEEVSMDFIIGLAKSKGNNLIVAVVDRLIKYGHFFLCFSSFQSKYSSYKNYENNSKAT